MAIQVNRQIVTDQLVACFDAASPRSYTGALPWVDLSKNSTNTTGNLPPYTGVNNGAFAFNRTLYADYNTKVALNNKITVEMWFKLTGAFSDCIPFGFLLYCVYVNGSNAMGYNTGGGDVYGISPTTFGNLGMSNSWRQAVFVMNSDVSYSNNKMYINASGQTLSQQAGVESAASRSFNNGSGTIGSLRANSSYCTPMQCAIFRLYNKELSLSEIEQNFQANRSRFGL
jgi:hypothetical protein